MSFGAGAGVGVLPAAMPLIGGGGAGPAVNLLSAWDGLNKSSALVIDPSSGVLRNSGSMDKWQSCRSLKPFSAAGGSSRHRFDVEEAVAAEPEEPGFVGVYLSDEIGWLSLALPESERDGVADTLDVARLSEFVLDPMLGIKDPRTDANIAFVGGIRGPEELERLVDAGEAEIAFAMFPTAPEDLLDVSDAGELMPPKSTWFEPKLRSGLLIHRF